MKIVLSLLTVLLFQLVLTGPSRAQVKASSDSDDAHSHFKHYKVVDLGSFGGGNSYAQGVFLPLFPGTTTLNHSGTVAAWGDTATPDPFSPACYVDCLVGYALKWLDGTANNLGALPSTPVRGSQAPCFDCAWWSSFPLAISHNGLLVGQSEDNDVDSLTGGRVRPSALPRRFSLRQRHDLARVLVARGKDERPADPRRPRQHGLLH